MSLAVAASPRTVELSQGDEIEAAQPSPPALAVVNASASVSVSFDPQANRTTVRTSGRVRVMHSLYDDSISYHYLESDDENDVWEPFF